VQRKKVKFEKFYTKNFCEKIIIQILNKILFLNCHDFKLEYIITRLQYIDRIFGNENFLKDVEENLFDEAIPKTRMRTIDRH
jgi:hypothetical protein